MVYTENGLDFYYYGEKNAPVGGRVGAQVFSKIVDKARSRKKPFEDPYFPADSTSFGHGLDLKDDEGNPLTIKWLRPKKIAKEKFKADPIFHGPFNEFGVNQGSVGDCWFLSSLADVALKPKLINTLIPADNQTVGFDSGAFHFRFWCRGKWVDVTVDDRLPYSMFDGEIGYAIFTKPTPEGGFWAALLEKAYAKLYGKYSDINEGVPADALTNFTGGFGLIYQPNKPNLKEIIQDAMNKGDLMTVGTTSAKKVPPELMGTHDKNSPGSEDQSKEGIVLDHAYSLLDIQDVKSRDGQEVYTLVKLRNPWGNDVEWNGDFGDKDKNGMWEQVEEDLRMTQPKGGDGEFWMPLKNIIPYADEFTVCHWNAVYLADKTVTTPDGEYYMSFGNWTKKSTVWTGGAGDLGQCPGYYVHLTPKDADADCKLSVAVMYLNYKKSSGDKIPAFGFYVLWAPGIRTPDRKYLDEVDSKNKERFFCSSIEDCRENSEEYKFSEGTAYIVPYLDKLSGGAQEVPYLLRIEAEGEVFELPGGIGADGGSRSGSASPASAGSRSRSGSPSPTPTSSRSRSRSRSASPSASGSD